MENAGAAMTTHDSVSLDIHDGLATLRLGQADEAMVTLSLRRMESLADALDQLSEAAAAGDVRGVVVRGATEKLFCAGADLKLLRALQERNVQVLRALLAAARRLTSDERRRFDALIDEQSFAKLAEELAWLGKEIFQRLAALKIPTVAAISGACLGGGLELALHCRWLVAAEATSVFSGGVKTELGFPEPMLGLLQGWGGIERTVPRVGLRPALPLLLQGKSIGPQQALRLGLVDAVAAGEQLYNYAADVALGRVPLNRRRIGVVDRLLTGTAAGRRVVADGIAVPLLGKLIPGARDALREFPPEHYPAPHAILEVALEEARSPSPLGSPLASRRFGELAASPQSEALVHVLFFGTEAAKARAKSEPRAKDLSTLVVGAGQMGAGIAHALLRSGQRVIVHDSHATAISAAQRRIEGWIAADRKLSPDDKLQMQRNIRYEAELPSELRGIDFAIEAVVENLAVKQQVLAMIASRLSPTAMLATNTSSLSIAALAESVSGPQRFFGMHYFNPVRQMRLVEIVRGPHTSDDAVALAAALATAQGKFPIVVQDVPGFLVNRILFPYLNEAVRLVLEGFTIDSIDREAQRFGMFMGPLKTIDLVGFDVAREVAAILTRAYADRIQPPTLATSRGETLVWDSILDELAQRGVLGKKSKRGFYLYQEGRGVRRRPQPNPLFSDSRFWAQFGASAPPQRRATAEVIHDRLIDKLLDEAVRSRDEGVAGSDRADAALQIDLASVLGFGFAPFRGGLIHYHEQRRLQSV